LKRQWPSDGFDELGPTTKSLGSLFDTNPVLPLQIQLTTSSLIANLGERGSLSRTEQ
jgi:hypothetical protein